MKDVPFQNIEDLPYIPPVLGVKALERIGVLQTDHTKYGRRHGHFDPDSFVQDLETGIFYPTVFVPGLIGTELGEALHTANEGASVIGACSLNFLGSREDINSLLADSSIDSTKAFTRQALKIALALGVSSPAVVAQTVAQILERVTSFNMNTDTTAMQTLEKGTFAFRNLQSSSETDALTTADLATATASGWSPMGKSSSIIRKMFDYFKGMAQLSYSKVCRPGPDRIVSVDEPLHKLAHDNAQPHSFWDDVVRVLSLLRPNIFERIGSRVEELSKNALEGMPFEQMSVLGLSPTNGTDLN